MTFLVNIFIFLAIVCEVLFIVGLVTVAYHLVKALTGMRYNKWWRK